MIEKEKYLTNMAANLLVLRTKLGLTQEELGSLAGISRQTIVQAEKAGKMSWNTYLSLVFIFEKEPETKQLMDFLNIYPVELNELIAEKSTKDIGDLEER